MPKSTVFFWGDGGLLDIREGQRCQNRPFFFLGRRGGFLTFGKVNGAQIDRFFFGRRGVLNIREGQRCQNRPFFFGGGGFLTFGKVIGAKIDRFSGEGGGGGVQI